MKDNIAEIISSKIAISKGSMKDLIGLVEVNYSIFSGVYEVEPYTILDYKKRLYRVRPHILVARDEQNIVGDSIAFPYQNAFYIWVLGVCKNYRRQGIASQLFELNERHAREQGYHAVTTKVYSASEGMLKLVKKRGYSVMKFYNAKDCGKGEFYFKIRKNLS